MRLNNVSLNQLRTFMSVVRNESFTRAGQDLSLSPATITSQIKQLEESLETQLFFRTTRSVRLTDAGRALARQAIKILHLVEAIPEKVGAVQQLETGEVRVGVISSAKYVMPRVLSAYQREHPGISIDMTIANRDHIWEAILQGEIDLGIMGTPPEDVNIEAHVIAHHQLIMLCHPEHALARVTEPVDAKALIRYPLIAREVGSGTRLAMAAFFGGLFHQTTKAPMVLDSNEGIKQAILANMGISLLSDSTCQLELELGLLHHIPVNGTPLPRRWFAVRTAQTERNPAEESLLAFLIDYGPRITQASSRCA